MLNGHIDQRYVKIRIEFFLLSHTLSEATFITVYYSFFIFVMLNGHIDQRYVKIRIFYFFFDLNCSSKSYVYIRHSFWHVTSRTGYKDKDFETLFGLMVRMCLRKRMSGRRRDGNFVTLTERYEAGVSAGRWGCGCRDSKP